MEDELFRIEQLQLEAATPPQKWPICGKGVSKRRRSCARRSARKRRRSSAGRSARKRKSASKRPALVDIGGNVRAAGPLKTLVWNVKMSR